MVEREVAPGVVVHMMAYNGRSLGRRFASTKAIGCGSTSPTPVTRCTPSPLLWASWFIALLAASPVARAQESTGAPATLLVDAMERRFYDYLARGAPFGPDDGTIAPRAAVATRGAQRLRGDATAASQS